MTATTSSWTGHGTSGLCEHLAHAANGWHATHLVQRADGRGPVGIRDMCAAARDRPRGNTLATVNVAQDLLWIDLATTVPLHEPSGSARAPSRMTAPRRR